MGILQDLERGVRANISVNDAVGFLAAFEEVSDAQAAAWLFDHRAVELLEPVRISRGRVGYDPRTEGFDDDADRAEARDILRAALKFLELHGERLSSNPSLAGLNQIGWLRDSFWTFVTQRGVQISADMFSEIGACPSFLHPDFIASPETRQGPLPFVGGSLISVMDAAAILAVRDPSRDAMREYAPDVVRWADALIAANDSGEIYGDEWTLHPHRYEQMLSSPGVRAWCEKNGHGWRIPFATALPEPDTELIERLRVAEEACAKLTEQLAEAAASTDDSEPQIPEWMQRQIGLKRIALWDAAKMLAGIAPSEIPHPDSEKSREVDEWHYALEDAIDVGEISAPRWNEIRCEQMALHAEIRAWCTKHGHKWPIPDPNPVPAIDAELGARLRAAEEEISRLRAAGTELNGITETTNDLEMQLAEKEIQLAEKEAELAELYAWLDDADDIGARANEAETERDGSDQGLGDKERASLQKQIAALALALAEKGGKYKRGNNPNASAIAGLVDEILTDLEAANTHGTGNSSIRSSISAGLTLLLSQDE
jgi:hypothetical protein